MPRPRVIPILLLDQQRLVKTRQFNNPVYVGDPLNVVRIFNEKEVDELIILDIGATIRGTSPDFGYLEELAGECFVPLTYGGGIRSENDAARLFRGGIEKIALNTAVQTAPQLLTSLRDAFGSQSIVASIDVRRDRKSGNLTVANTGRKKQSTHRLSDLLRIAEEHGAGEILLQSIDREGTLTGPDLAVIHEAKDLSVPLIYAGGISCAADISAAIQAGADAIGVGAWFVFHGPHRAVLIWYPSATDLTLVGQVQE